LKGKRKVYWGKQYANTPVYDRYLLKPNQLIKGPCIIEEFESTTVVGYNSTVKADRYNNLVIELL
jgi:N-methylhydantoinase A/oxoprolinase/acetone carboxylase beta subunit